MEEELIWSPDGFGWIPRPANRGKCNVSLACGGDEWYYAAAWGECVPNAEVRDGEIVYTRARLVWCMCGWPGGCDGLEKPTAMEECTWLDAEQIAAETAAAVPAFPHTEWGLNTLVQPDLTDYVVFDFRE